MFKVLIIEDEDIIREGLKFSLDWGKENCQIVGEAANGVEALEKITKLKPDILLLDLNMPLKNGLMVLKESYQTALYSTIIISGYDDFEKAKEAIKYGVTEYLLKPVDHEELIVALRKAREAIELKQQYQFLQEKLNGVEDVDILDFKRITNRHKLSKEVARLISFIEEEYNQKIRLQDLVFELNRSKTYLNQKFKLETGYTFNEYLNRYRVYQAIYLLKNSDEKISSIALEVGFSNYRYFIDIFKKYTQVLPSDFVSYSKGYVPEV